MSFNKYCLGKNEKDPVKDGTLGGTFRREQINHITPSKTFQQLRQFRAKNLGLSQEILIVIFFATQCGPPFFPALFHHPPLETLLQKGLMIPVVLFHQPALYT